MQTVGHRFGEAEIGDFDGGVVVFVHEENVLRLDIAVDDVLVVQILDHFQHVLHQRSRLHFVVPPQLDDPIEEVAARHQLHDNVQVLLRREATALRPPCPG